MALTPIDYDRGCSIKFLSSRGLTVIMYKDAPGVYYAPNGAVLEAEVAREAGFDVDGEAREASRLAKRAAALASIDQEFGVLAEGEVVAEEKGFQVVNEGRGWFNVLDSEGVLMSPHKMRREAAIEFMGALKKEQ